MDAFGCLGDQWPHQMMCASNDCMIPYESARRCRSSAADGSMRLALGHGMLQARGKAGLEPLQKLHSSIDAD